MVGHTRLALAFESWFELIPSQINFSCDTSSLSAMNYIS